MLYTIALTESELHTIDVTLRMRLTMIALELDDNSISEFTRHNLMNERDCIWSLLKGHQVFINLENQYRSITE